ncbi:MAG: rod shape-determining protein MreD [Kiritimatiellia bacterium]|nr:rod shape-determining protein MreD [Lentisphaerota bacterium]
MIWLIMVLAVGAAIVLENAVPAWQACGQARLPAVVCVVMYYALNHAPAVALLAGLLAGVMVDAASGMPHGYSPLVFCVLSMLVGRYRDFVFIRRWLTHMFLGAFAGLALTLMTYGLLLWRLEYMRELAPGWVFLKALGTAGMGLLCMPLVFVGLEALETCLGCRGSLVVDDF